MVEDVLLGLYYVTTAIAGVLPAPVFYGLVKGFGAFLYYARPRVMRDMRSKISEAMPEVTSTRKLDRIGRGAYTALLMPVADLALFRRDFDRFERELVIEGMEYLEEADALGRGVLMPMTHMGRAALIHAMMARIGKPGTQVMWHPDTTPVPRYVMKMFMETLLLGCDPDNLVIWVGPDYDTIGEVRAALEEGKRVIVPWDITGKRATMLFGHPASLADGLGHWALEAGVPLVPVVMTRTRRSYRSRLIFGEPLSFEVTGDRATDVSAVMREVTRSGERMIREAPEQWMSWFGIWQWWSQAEELQASQRKESQGNG
jgi:lauroyl/myristoyl acyltransferase